MEENEEKQVPVIPGGVKTGVTLGAISIIMTLAAYLINSTLLASTWFGISIFVISIALFFVLGIKFRKENSGYLAFGQAYVFSFVTLAVSGLIGTIFNILLYVVIDPDLVTIIVDATIENTRSIMEAFGGPEGSIEDELDKMAEDLPLNYTAIGFIKSYGIALIVIAVVSLITGLIIKKNEPIIDDF